MMPRNTETASSRIPFICPAKQADLTQAVIWYRIKYILK